jgi:hypothetical protein
MNSRLSSKKKGFVKIFIRPAIDERPWVRVLGGKRTTKQVLESVRKTIAKRLKKRRKDLRYEPYKEGWIFLCEGKRIIWKIRERAADNRGWVSGEEWIVEHSQLHGEHPGYDE